MTVFRNAPTEIELWPSTKSLQKDVTTYEPKLAVPNREYVPLETDQVAPG